MGFVDDRVHQCIRKAAYGQAYLASYTVKLENLSWDNAAFIGRLAKHGHLIVEGVPERSLRIHSPVLYFSGSIGWPSVDDYENDFI